MVRRPVTPALLLALFCFVHLPQGYGQKADTAELISVSLKIVGKGTPIYATPRDTAPGYFALVTVTNRQDTTIHFWVMSCSWAIDNFVTSSDSIRFWYPGCDHNIPDNIDLLPHHSVDFYGCFKPSKKVPLPRTVKLGLIYVNRQWDLWDYIAGKKALQQFAVYWSNSVRIVDNLYQYRVN